MFSFFLQGKVGDMMAPIKSPEAQLLIAIQNRQQDKVRGESKLPFVSGLWKALRCRFSVDTCLNVPTRQD